MNDIDVISYQAWAGGGGMAIVQTATSIRDVRESNLWQRRLDPWLRLGSPLGCAYLDLGSQAAFIRWQGDAALQLSQLEWHRATVLVGQSARLTGTAALELADPDESGAIPGLGVDWTPGPRRDALEALARSEDAITALIPLLAHALQGARRVRLPWEEQGLAEAVMWGFLSILRMIGDSRAVSFRTYTSGADRDADAPGMLVSFRPGIAEPLPPDQGFAALATDLARRFADDPAGLRRILAKHGLPQAADDRGRISRLLALPPQSPSGATSGGGTPSMTVNAGEPATPSVTPAAPARPATPAVMCPICLGDIGDWNALDYWRWDASLGDGEGDYGKIDIPADLNPTQRARYTHGAYVRCNVSGDEHYLPARYGRFGEPVLLGFVGLTQSGKTHLLASMVGAISGLSDYGMEVTELDRATHRDFLEKFVKPLITGHKVLPGTPDDATTALADAFIVKHGDGPERVVALFDVSGGNLARVDDTTEFLWIADGLFFIVDPDHIGASKVGDETFSSVLGIMAARPKPEKACAAIILNKADKARFEEPVARWLRAGNGTLEPTEFLRESADVYAYLEQHQAVALAKPYLACSKATLHVASPTGGAQEGEDKASKYPRGVTPLRVLRPLVAMLAMTGVITGPQAEEIGV